ncbi:MAG: DUF1801 domain-containing protein [Bacteroidota bacterium]
MKSEQAKNIDEYIAAFPENVQELLQIMRATIQEAAPEATEAIAYAIPTFKQNGNLVHFAGYKNHIGFYPAPMGFEAFKEETAQYEAGKGTLQFPIDKPLPLDLVTRIVKFRIEKNLEKGKKKK